MIELEWQHHNQMPGIAISQNQQGSLRMLNGFGVN
jgi:hypothetical protein